MDILGASRIDRSGGVVSEAVRFVGVANSVDPLLVVSVGGVHQVDAAGRMRAARVERSLASIHLRHLETPYNKDIL